ncbi:MAG: chromosomal replication initiator protein DnaA [Dehalococcoidia bacterium]
MDTSKARKIWDTALGELQLQVTRPYYETYLRNTVGLEHESDRFTVGVPTSFGVEWLYLRMRPRIEETLRGIIKQPVNAQFVVCQDSTASNPSAPQKEGTTRGPAGPTEASQRDWESPNEVESTSSPLNHRYTFDTFVVSNCNRMAHAASKAVAERPGQTYNPLFIYSDLGLGKTHLLHAIGHATISARRRVLYISAEQFTNDLVAAIRERWPQRFQDKYRRVDLLLVDDIQFIGGKEQTQEGFYHTFNHLHNINKQIVLASDCHPREIPLVEDRLISRFEGGLLADIQPPDLETRTVILQAKAAQRNAAVEPEVLDAIARRVRGSVRRLEGALHRVLAYAEASEAPMTPDLVGEAISDSSKEKAQQPSAAAIIESSAAHFNLNSDDLRGKRRLKTLVEARDIAIYLLREEMKLSPMRIGGLMGDRTPASVAMSCRKISSKLALDTDLRNNLSSIRDSLYSRPTAA